MMDLLAGLAHGFVVLAEPAELAACVLGLLAGLVVGFLPGISPAGGLMLATSGVVWIAVGFGFQSPVVFLTAFAYGTLYGRALAAINIAATRAPAGPLVASDRRVLVAIALIGVAVAVAASLLVGVSRPFSLTFGPVELSALIAFVLLAGAAFGRGSAAGALAMVVLGLLLRVVGTDLETGVPRLTFGLSTLEDGFSFLEVALGLFVIANAIDGLVQATRGEANVLRPDPAVRDVWLSALLAALSGFVPTNGETFAATTRARSADAESDPLDPASQRGVSSIIQAAILSDIRLCASMIPLFLWLLPVDAMTALLRGTVNGQAMLTQTLTDLSPIAWLAGATLAFAHIVPLALVAVLARLPWRPVRIDVRVIAPLIALSACVMTWSLHGADWGAVGVMLVFGLAGYGMIRCGFDRSLMFFAFAVEPTFEENIRRTLMIARGDGTVYLQRPMSVVLLLAGALLLVGARWWRGNHRMVHST
jgi:putative tricarboxylic transport membrane protein